MAEHERLPDEPKARHAAKMSFEEGMMSDAGLTMFQRVIGFLIVRHWNEKKEVAFPGHDRLGAMAPIKGKPATRQGVGKAVDALEARGWFDVEGRGKTAVNVSLRYYPRWSRGQGASVPEWSHTQTADYVSPAAKSGATRKLQNAEQVNCRTPDTETAGYPNPRSLTDPLNTDVADAPRAFVDDAVARELVTRTLWELGIDGELTLRECMARFRKMHGGGPTDPHHRKALWESFVRELVEALPAHDQRNRSFRLSNRG